MFKIGDFSKLCRVSIRMLRYYDSVGLFTPASVDAFTGYRYYSASQIRKINMIVSLRDMGFTVNDIALVLNEPSSEQQKKRLALKKAEIEHDIVMKKSILNKINAAIENLDMERKTMNYDVKIKDVPSYKVISVRDIIPAYDHEGDLWQRLCDIVEKNKIQTESVNFAMYHDTEHKDESVDVEVVFEVDTLQEGGPGYTFKETEAVKNMASVLVPGDFSNIGPAFEFLGKWIEENNYSITGLSRQYTLKGPWNEDNPSNYLCEIQIPISK